MRHARMPAGAILLLAALTAGPAAGAPDDDAPAEAIRLAAPKAYPQAGLEFALPAGFDYVQPEDPKQIARVVRTADGEAAMAVTVEVLPVPRHTRLTALADGMLEQLRNDLSLTRVRSMKRTDMPIAGQKGLAELYRYRRRGKDRTAVRLYFLRDVEPARLALCTMVTVVASPTHKRQVLDVFAGVIRSVKVRELAHPDMDVQAFGPPVRRDRQGYAIAPPRGWYVYPDRSVLKMGQLDCVARALLPQALVAVRDVPAERDARACARRRLEQLRDTDEKGKVSTRLIRQGPAKLAGQDAWEYVALKVPAGDEVQAEDKVVVVGRELCSAGEEGQPARNYSLALYCRGDDADAAGALLDKLAARFELIEPEAAAKDGESEVGAALRTSVPIEGD